MPSNIKAGYQWLILVTYISKTDRSVKKKVFKKCTCGALQIFSVCTVMQVCDNPVSPLFKLWLVSKALQFQAIFTSLFLGFGNSFFRQFVINTFI